MSDNHHLEFAKRHSNPIASTFDAYSAIWRLQALLEDVDNLGALVNAQPPDGVHLPFYGLEVASYYTVGFVTCLEWHAKSRLNDLFSYKPASVRSDDLKGLVGDKVVSQMTATGVTVPQLLAAATKIGNSHSYLKVFERLFEALGVELKLYEILAKDIFEELSAAGDGSRSRVDRFKELFEYRNNLVHEIDISVIGSYTFRGNLTIESARDLGVKALNIISEIERQLTLHAQTIFQICSTIPFFLEMS